MLGPHPLRMMTLNAENLFVFIDAANQTVAQPHQLPHLSEDAWQKLSSSTIPNKPIRQVRELAKCIIDVNPDLVFLSEVGGLESLQHFNAYFLGGAYQELLIEGNSDRGIDVGFLAKRKTGLRYDLRTHKNRPLDFLYPHEKLSSETGYHGEPPKTIVHRFSRDVLEVRAFLEESTTPLFIALAVHLKSQLDRDKIDPLGRDRRKAELEKLIEIYQEIDQEFSGQVPILIGGDFNGNASRTDTEDEFRSLYEKTDLLDALECANIPLDHRFTHMQIYPNGASRNRQLDYLMISPLWQNNVVATETFVFRFLDEFGMPMLIPRNFNEKLLMPTDHYPVVVTFRF